MINETPRTDVISDDEKPVMLFVDDEADIREFVAMEFTADFHIIEARDGVEGYQKLKVHFPDIVITDRIMPNMDGIELCSRLKNDPETDHIPVVMLTAKSDVSSQLEGLDCGADDYVTKPFNPELLKARVNNILQNRRVLCEHYMQVALGRRGEALPDGFKERAFVEKLLRIMEERYTDWTFGVEHLAEAVGMSLRTLQRKLKALMNRTPAEFITDFRMKRACELLAGSAITIAEVAFAVGYDESSSFSRVFKRQFEITPSEYRQAHH